MAGLADDIKDFGERPPADESDDEPQVELFGDKDLENLSRDDLLAHAMQLQNSYLRLEREYKFIRWEFDEYQKTLTLFSRTAKLSHRLNASDMDTVVSVAVNELPSYLNCRFAALFFYHDDRKVMELHRSSRSVPDVGPLHIVENASHFLVKLLFRQTEPYLAEYVDDHTIRIGEMDLPVEAGIPSEWIRALGNSCLVLPLHVKQNEATVLLGGLLLGDPTRDIEQSDTEAAMIFSDILSSSLYNARLVQQLNEMTIVDSLTGIYNRRYMLARLNNAMLNANRYGHPLSIAMLDIDHFKRFNDTYGHLCGDAVLKETGDLLKKAVRADIDIPSRYGGEEFVIIMPSIDGEHAKLAADRIRARIMKHVVHFRERELSITCSVGVAEYRAGESVEKFIDRADAALYQAKDKGRNRVVADFEIEA